MGFLKRILRIHLGYPKKAAPEKVNLPNGLQLISFPALFPEPPQLLDKTGDFRQKGICGSKMKVFGGQRAGEGAHELPPQHGIFREQAGMKYDAEKLAVLTAAGIPVMHLPGINQEAVPFF